jgi:hypothetical protein
MYCRAIPVLLSALVVALALICYQPLSDLFLFETNSPAPQLQTPQAVVSENIGAITVISEDIENMGVQSMSRAVVKKVLAIEQAEVHSNIPVLCF